MSDPMTMHFNQSGMVVSAAINAAASVIVDRVSELRFLSAAGSKNSVKYLDRLLHDHNPKNAATMHFYQGKSHLQSMKTVPCRTFTRQIEEGTWQLVAVAEHALDGRAAVANGQPIEDAILQALQDHTDIPLLSNWASALVHELDRQGHVLPWYRIGNAPEGTDLPNAAGALEEIVERLVSQGALAIPAGEPAPNEDIHQIGHIDTYMKVYGPSLGRQMATKARHTPGTAGPIPVLRRLYPAQADTVEATVKTWQDERFMVDPSVKTKVPGLFDYWRREQHLVVGAVGSVDNGAGAPVVQRAVGPVGGSRREPSTSPQAWHCPQPSPVPGIPGGRGGKREHSISICGLGSDAAASPLQERLSGAGGRGGARPYTRLAGRPRGSGGPSFGRSVPRLSCARILRYGNLLHHLLCEIDLGRRSIL